ncbi:MAG TPA: phytanoyl-CoA dioxygenase family protein [Rhizomicrobium sp.]|nr:phytanoyl-CoA dioxygenase family protein [Rhizomicrobium sp.]
MTLTFDRDGIVFPIPVFTADEIAGRYAALRALEGARAGRLPPLLNFKPHLLVPWLWTLIREPRILDPVAALLGEDLLCWEASFFSKGPNDKAFVTWHQDATYWGLTENIGVTAWLAFTPSTRANGCMRVIPGSHRRALTHVETQDRDNMLPAREQVRDAVDESRAVDVVLAPGEMSLHHPILIHGSEPNTSSERRVGLAIRYIGAKVAQRGPERGTATLVRGRDHGHFDLEQAPVVELGADERARHAVLLRRWMNIVAAEAAGHS